MGLPIRVGPSGAEGTTGGPRIREAVEFFNRGTERGREVGAARRPDAPGRGPIDQRVEAHDAQRPQIHRPVQRPGRRHPRLVSEGPAQGVAVAGDAG